MSNPFRYFNSSPEVIHLVVMMYVRSCRYATVHDRYKDLARVDIDQAWRLSRFCGGGGGVFGGPRRQAAPGRRRGADRLQRSDRLGIGAHEHGAFRAGAGVAAG